MAVEGRLRLEIRAASANPTGFPAVLRRPTACAQSPSGSDRISYRCFYSRNEVIQSHCVAPTALYGPGGPRSPYILRTHLETAAGVSLQVLLPIGETVTVARFENPRRLLASTAEVLGNIDSPDGCRTQIRTRVRDARKLLEGYSGGLGVHRVSFYGDYLEPLRKMGRLMGFEVVREG